MPDFTAPITYQFPENEQLNALTQIDYMSRIRSLAVSVFQWDNLPDGIPGRFIEQTLFNYGRALFFRVNDTGGLMVAKVADSGMIDKYDSPISFRAYASPDFNQDLPIEKCVLIRNNYDCIPTVRSVLLFVMRLAETERTIDINVKAQKTPLVFVCDQKQLQTLKMLFRKYDGNEPVIYADKSLDMKGLTCINPEVPYMADKLMLYKRNIWNECMTYLGINNANTDKKERLITDEANANNQLIEQSAAALLSTRQEAAKEINTMFGTDIRVSMRLKNESPVTEK